MGDEGDRYQGVIDAFLDGRSLATRQAYTNDLEGYATSQGQRPAEALRALLVERSKGQHLLLTYGIHLTLHGRAPATLRRQLTTLVALTRLAHDRGLVDFELEVPSVEEVEAATLVVTSNAHPDVAYFIPRGDLEVDRLDMQHYAVWEAFGGNYMAPVRRPRRVLDVGSGTGQWGFDLCSVFPGADVVGFDLVRSKHPWPLGYHCVLGNALLGLPFVSNGFDYVHMRFLVAGIPLAVWADSVRELVRVTQPGGWIEQMEVRIVAEPTGPATERVMGMARGMMARAGLDAAGEMYGDMAGYLHRAGMVVAGEEEKRLPVGEWGGRVGQLLATDLRTGLYRLADTFRVHFGIEEAEFTPLMVAATQEWEECHSTIPFKVVWARKPGW